MNVIEREISNFDVAQIADSGQCFRMNPHPTKRNTYTLIALGRYLEIEQEPGSNVVKFFGTTEHEFETVWKHYFDLETDYSKIIESVDPEDSYLSAAVQAGSGIRILSQDLWETVVSFLISQNNNVPRIKKSVETLCRTCGEMKYAPNGELFYCFPTPDKLSIVENLKPAKLGYRERYIAGLAQDIISGKINLSELRRKEQFMEICGIGKKVADCIMLFGLHDLAAFPIDTWIKRAIDQHYGGVFPIERYSGCAGVIQQYIFNYAIHGDKNK